jgi:endonuclease-3
MARVPTKKILDTLAQTYPDAKCALDHENAFQLLIATILSAQCTDKRVNIITARIFPKYPTPADFAALTPEQLAEEIKDCGLYQAKSRNIIETCRILLDKYGGEVPPRMEDLVQLPGVGRKTANVVLSNAFGIPAIAVDTHVFRVANRIGLAEADDVLKTEEQLMARIPKKLWSPAHHWLIHHGRQICDARNPKCHVCPIAAYCQYGKRRAAEAKVAARAAAKPAREKAKAARPAQPTSSTAQPVVSSVTGEKE